MLDALRCRIAAADDGERRLAQQIAPADVAERRRRIGNREQRRGVVCVIPSKQRMPRQGEPTEQAFELMRIRSTANRLGDVGACKARKSRKRGCAHFCRTAERLEQQEERLRRQPLYELERRPSLDAGVDVHRRTTRYGRRTTSPTTIGSVVLSTMA